MGTGLSRSSEQGHSSGGKEQGWWERIRKASREVTPRLLKDPAG